MPEIQKILAHFKTKLILIIQKIDINMHQSENIYQYPSLRKLISTSKIDINSIIQKIDINIHNNFNFEMDINFEIDIK